VIACQVRLQEWELDLYIHRDIMAAENMADILAYEIIFGADERPQYLKKAASQAAKK
jgi:hypothetical protein